MNENYLTTEEAAKILNIHKRTITKYLANGQIKGAKIGRIWRVDEKDVRAFFEDVKNRTEESIKKGGIVNVE